jgi:anti-sigma factor RsiW
MMSEWIDGRLPQSGVAVASQHIQTCSVCRARWQTLRQVSSVLRSSEMAQPPPDFTARVMRRLHAQEARNYARPSAAHSLLLTWGAVAATALLLIAVVALYSLSPSGGAADSSVSLNFVSMSMRISDTAVRAASVIEDVLAIPLYLVRVLPGPVLLVLIVWLIFGTLALGLTVAGLVAGYQPVQVDSGRDR